MTEASKAAMDDMRDPEVASALREENLTTSKTPTAEDIARTICLSYGRDPDEMSDWMEMCDAHNRPVPLWMVYEEQAEAVLAAYTISFTVGEG